MSKKHNIPFVHLSCKTTVQIEDANLLEVHVTLLFIQNLQSSVCRAGCIDSFIFLWFRSSDTEKNKHNK